MAEQDHIDVIVSAANTWLAEQNLTSAKLFEHPVFKATVSLSAEHSMRGAGEKYIFQMKRELRTALHIYDLTGSYVELLDCARRWLDG